MPKKEKQKPSETIILKIKKCKSSYHISKRSLPNDDDKIDDEYILDIDCEIIGLPKRLKTKHLRHECELSLLSAKNYPARKDSDQNKRTEFFGNITLRGQQRGGFSYLPSSRLRTMEIQIRASVFTYIEITTEYIVNGHGVVEAIYLTETNPVSE